MTITYFEIRILFQMNKLYEKMDAQVAPKNENKLRTIRRSDQLIGNEKKQIFYCLDVII